MTKQEFELNGRIWLQVGGESLPANKGPFRIIVQDEKKAARSVRQVVALRGLL